MGPGEGGIYRETLLYIYCDDPHGDCPLGGAMGTLDCWRIETHGPQHAFVRLLRSEGWSIGRRTTCPACRGKRDG